jgi:hypothetical protein
MQPGPYHGWLPPPVATRPETQNQSLTLPHSPLRHRNNQLLHLSPTDGSTVPQICRPFPLTGPDEVTEWTIVPVILHVHPHRWTVSSRLQVLAGRSAARAPQIASCTNIEITTNKLQHFIKITPGIHSHSFNTQRTIKINSPIAQLYILLFSPCTRVRCLAGRNVAS